MKLWVLTKSDLGTSIVPKSYPMQDSGRILDIVISKIIQQT